MDKLTDNVRNAYTNHLQAIKKYEGLRSGIEKWEDHLTPKNTEDGRAWATGEAIGTRVKAREADYREVGAILQQEIGSGPVGLRAVFRLSTAPKAKKAMGQTRAAAATEATTVTANRAAKQEAAEATTVQRGPSTTRGATSETPKGSATCDNVLVKSRKMREYWATRGIKIEPLRTSFSEPERGAERSGGCDQVEGQSHANGGKFASTPVSRDLQSRRLPA